MSRKEFTTHLEIGIAQYFANNDVLLSFDELNDIGEHITEQVDHTMENFM